MKSMEVEDSSLSSVSPMTGRKMLSMWLLHSDKWSINTKNRILATPMAVSRPGTFNRTRIQRFSRLGMFAVVINSMMHGGHERSPSPADQSPLEVLAKLVPSFLAGSDELPAMLGHLLLHLLDLCLHLLHLQLPHRRWFPPPPRPLLLINSELIKKCKSQHFHQFMFKSLRKESVRRWAVYNLSFFCSTACDDHSEFGVWTYRPIQLICVQRKPFKICSFLFDQVIPYLYNNKNIIYLIFIVKSLTPIYSHIFLSSFRFMSIHCNEKKNSVFIC